MRKLATKYIIALTKNNKIKPVFNDDKIFVGFYIKRFGLVRKKYISDHGLEYLKFFFKNQIKGNVNDRY